MLKFFYKVGFSYRNSPVPERKKENRSRSKSKQPEEKRIPVWETKDVSTPPRTKYSEIAKNSNYTNKRRYENNDYERRHDDNREQSYYQPREKYLNRGRYDNYEQNRQENYQNRPENDRFGPNWRRPYQRGGYRNQNVRNSEQYGDGPSNRFRDEEASRNKVKLVDY